MSRSPVELFLFPNDILDNIVIQITSQYLHRTVYQRYSPTTDITNPWHYNYNRTPLQEYTMPRTRQPKRSNRASSARSEKRVKKVNKLLTGENKAGLTPAIPFCDAVKDVNDTDVKYVSIKVKIDQDKADSRVNLEDKKFLEITGLTYNGVLVSKV